MGPVFSVLPLLLLSGALLAQSSPGEKSDAQAAAARTPAKHVCTDLSRTEIVPCPGETPAAKPVAQPAQSSAKTSGDSAAPIAPSASSHSSATAGDEPVSARRRNSKLSALAAEAPPDANLGAIPDPTIFHASGLRDLPLNLIQDQRNFFTSPLRARTSDLNLLLPFAAATGVLAAGVDRGIESHLPTSASVISRSKTISDYSAAAMAGGVAGTWVLGRIRNDDRMAEAGILSGEAAVSTLAIAELGKYAFGRQRPQVGDGKGSFFAGGDSFPSLHSAAAFSIAEVMSQEYPSPFVRFLTFGAATGIAATRVTGRQHFASDALVGAGLGWFMGRQVYRAHHDNDGDLKRWGTFERAADGDRPRTSSLGSPYVPLDSWVYPAFDRLIALGIIQGGFVAMRPWTRRMCAELLEEAVSAFNGANSSAPGFSILTALEQEFAPELSGSSRPFARVESIYTKATVISGPPLTDGFHFGQTIINDFGRPYQRGFNSYVGVSGDAVYGPLTLYIRAEYQRAPAANALPFSARQAIGAADDVPTPPLLTTAATNNLTFLDTYIGFDYSDWRFTFGRQSLWWGPGEGGPMMFSDNAAPITMLRMDQLRPVTLPSIFGWLGPLRTELFVGRLTGHQFIDSPSGLIGQWGEPLSDQPFIHGQRISFHPTADFEFGFSRTTIFGGSGYPVTSSSFWRSLTSTANTLAGNVNKPGDRRSGLDFSYRVPKLRKWLSFYGDGFTEDEYSPVAYWDRSVWRAGLYIPRVPRLQNLDLRAEGVYTDNPLGGLYAGGYFYWNGTWRNGYTNASNLLGSWVGRNGQGAIGTAAYHLTARDLVQLSFRHQKISHQFIPGGGTITDVGISGQYTVNSGLEFFLSLQHELYRVPALASGSIPNTVASLTVIFTPRPSLLSKR